MAPAHRVTGRLGRRAFLASLSGGGAALLAARAACAEDVVTVGLLLPADRME